MCLFTFYFKKEVLAGIEKRSPYSVLLSKLKGDDFDMKKIFTFSIILSLLVSVIGFVNEKEVEASTGPFVHPGLLHTQADFDRMKQMVNAGTRPYLDGYNQLVNSSLSSSNWIPRATDTIIRGGTGDNVSLLYIDIARAYQNALLWKITGNTANGN